MITFALAVLTVPGLARAEGEPQLPANWRLGPGLPFGSAELLLAVRARAHPPAGELACTSVEVTTADEQPSQQPSQADFATNVFARRLRRPSASDRHRRGARNGRRQGRGDHPDRSGRGSAGTARIAGTARAERAARIATSTLAASDHTGAAARARRRASTPARATIGLPHCRTKLRRRRYPGLPCHRREKCAFTPPFVVEKRRLRRGNGGRSPFSRSAARRRSSSRTEPRCPARTRPLVGIGHSHPSALTIRQRSAVPPNSLAARRTSASESRVGGGEHRPTSRSNASTSPGTADYSKAFPSAGLAGAARLELSEGLWVEASVMARAHLRRVSVDFEDEPITTSPRVSLGIATALLWRFGAR